MSRARVLADRANQNTLAVDTTNSEVGIASTVPNATLDVRGEVKVGTAVQLGSAGVVTATSFSGSGSNLTGLATTETVRTDTLTVAGVSTLTGAVNIDATTDSTSTTTGALIVDGGAAIAKNVYIGAGLSVAGTLTYEDVTNVDSVGLITAKSGVNVSGGQLQVGVAYSVGAAGVATAAGFVGPLTGAVTGNVTGNADTATNATNATNVTVADESSDTTCFPLFVTTNTGTIPPKVGSNLTFNSSSGALTATSFVGALTGNVTGTASNASGATGDFSIADKIIHTGDTNTALRFPAADTITAETGGSERVRVASNGRVGVGTASPRAFLDLYGAAENATLLLESNDANANLCLMDDSGSVRFLNYGGELALRTGGTGAFTGDNERVRITSAGRLGIGITNPSSMFEVAGATPQIRSTDTDASNDYSIFQNSSGNSVYNAVDNNSAGGHIFQANASEKARIDSSGRLLLGTTTEGQASADDLTIATAGATGITIRSATNANGNLFFSDGTSGADEYRGYVQYQHNVDTLELGSNGATRLKIDTNGGFIFSNGALLEKCNITAGKLSDNTNIDLDNGMVHYFTTQESTTCTPNIRVNSSTELNDIMTAGDVITVTLVTTAAAAGYSANILIDSQTITEEWVGGSAPSAGGSDGLDVYSYTIICIHASNTGDSGFKVIANYINATN